MVILLWLVALLVLKNCDQRGFYLPLFVSFLFSNKIYSAYQKKKKKKEKKKKEVKLMWKEERGRWVNFHQSHFFHFHFLLDYKIHHQNHPLTKKTPLFKISHIPPPPSPSPQKSLNQTGCKRKIYL